jgi:hypothetical protein
MRHPEQKAQAALGRWEVYGSPLLCGCRPVKPPQRMSQAQIVDIKQFMGEPDVPIIMPKIATIEIESKKQSRR